MSEDRHREVSELFHQACELKPEERRAFLDTACAGDAELRAEVASMLVHDQASAEPLESGSTATRIPPKFTPPARVGPYRVLETLYGVLSKFSADG